MTFHVAWQDASRIAGWLTRREAEMLWKAAETAPRDGTIVEVGAYRGRSTCVLAHTGRNVLTIDPLVPGTGEAYGMRVEEADAAALAGLVARFENVKWVRAERDRVVPPPRVDLLYIDGDHTGQHPLDDFLHFDRDLARGASVLWHDANVEPVLAAIQTLSAAGRVEITGLADRMCLTLAR